MNDISAPYLPCFFFKLRHFKWNWIFSRKLQVPKFDSSITQKKSISIKYSSCATQTIESKSKNISVATQTDCTSSTDLINDDATAIRTDQNKSVIFGGIIETSLELLDDITDTTKDIARLTRDAEVLFAKMPVGTSKYSHE